MQNRLPLLLTMLAVSAGPASAQAPQPARIRGVIQALNGDALTVSTDTGAVQLTLGDNTGINGLEKRSISDIRDDVFIGTTAVKDANGRWRATEVHIFPDAMRGAGEGHYAWDLPGSTMTNAAVMGTARSRGGRTLELEYTTGGEHDAGGKIEVDVTRDTAIVALVPGDRSLLVPGATVFALAAPREGGGANALAIIAETDRVKPPM
jgi:hypothetical protein